MENNVKGIPMEQRQSWGSLAFIWIGSMICVSSLMTGGLLISGLSVMEAFLASIIGYGVVVIYMCFQGMQASDTGLSTVEMASGAFGEKGAKMLMSSALGIACLGWFGFQANICGSAFSQTMATFGLNIPVWASSLIWGVIMLTTAVYGINALKYLNYIAVPALIAVCFYGSYTSLAKQGFGIITSYQPTNPMSFLSGLALTVGSFALGGVIAGDYSRYARSRSDVIKSSIFGVIPAGIAMITMGGIMSLVSGTYDISQVLTDLGVPVLGLVVLILATWTTNTVNAYSGGLAITNLFNLSDSKRSMATAIAGFLGTILAVAGIINYFTNFLMVLTAALPPVAGVMIADYWIVKKGDPRSFKETKGMNMVGICSWLVGSIVAIVFKFGIQPINGIIVSMIVYLAVCSLQTKTSENMTNEEEII
ncbi:cytosine permease [Brassicibacter mesophilus]|uniref:cytosine permease n=1 Tax=Brassicibacter mesophilus TaxID=745119 RepID=UPI003D212667